LKKKAEILHNILILLQLFEILTERV